jgi:ABC-type branched-subunit amino acid transport system substrate-binding protein
MKRLLTAIVASLVVGGVVAAALAQTAAAVPPTSADFSTTGDVTFAPVSHAAPSIVLAPGQPLEIAVPVDQTTPGLAALGTAARNAVQLAIESHPRIRGFAVQQDDVAASSCFDPAANAAAATSIVANPDVAGVVGHLCSSGLAGALPVYESAGMVVLSGSATDPSLTGLGPSVFDRTIVNDADNGANWLTAVEQLSSVLAWQQRYQARFGIAPTSFAELYYDAANLLLNRINQVATLDPSGNLVLDRRRLAAAVRHTTNFQGVSGCISLDAVGNRLNNLGACG